MADLQQAAAERIAASLKRIIAEHDACLLAISGGSAPPGVFRYLSTEPLRVGIPWEKVSVIWADERYVPYTHPESNYTQARQSLLDHVPIPSEQVYPLATAYRNPADATAIYNRLVRTLIEAHDNRIDLALLGMGPDGHTASLFPGHQALAAPTDAYAVLVEDSPKPPPIRVSLSPTALKHIREAIFLVSGADKAPKVQAALRGPYAPSETPAQLVRPPQGHVIWMLDQAAAALLS
ncbi:MAG: 6-phosphogluconolactonase [Oscillochloris sp.]|nr:6-phosphogluconolactonase [Oscillochloris sp.]